MFSAGFGELSTGHISDAVPDISLAASRDAGWEVLMYARVPTFKIGVQDLDASIRFFEETTLPRLREIAGFKGATVLVDRQTGVLRIVAYWDSRESLRSSFEPTKALRAAYVDKLGAEQLSLEEFEVAVQV